VQVVGALPVLVHLGVGAEHVVVAEHVPVAERLHPLCVRTGGSGVATQLCLRKDHADLHGGVLPPLATPPHVAGALRRRRGRSRLQAVTSLERRARRSADGEVVLPLTFGQAVRSEFRRCFQRPYETPIVVAANAALMLFAWYLIPFGLREFFFRLHGSLALPMVLAVWMYSDVPATNVIAPDRRRMLAALEEPDELRLLWSAKNVALWLLVSPCASWSPPSSSPRAATGGRDCRPWCGSPSFPSARSGSPGGWASSRPTTDPAAHPAMNRRPWRHMIWRWLALALLPYGFVPALATALTFPSALLWDMSAKHGLSGPLSPVEFTEGVALTCAVAIAGWVGGHFVGLGLLERRRAALRGYLSDPLHG